METIKIGDQELSIETRPITLIVPSAQMAMGPRIRYPQRVSLDPEATVYHAQRVQKLHPDFEKCWRLFMRNTTPETPVGEVSAEMIRKMGTGATHLAGLIDLTLKLTERKIPVAWVFPESYLHPGWQVALADLALHFSLGANR